MGVLDSLDLSKVKVFEKSTYFTPGRYRVEIKEIKQIEGRNGEVMIIEAIVLESSPGPKGEEPVAVGTTCAQVIPLEGPNKESGRGNMMGFYAATLHDCKVSDHSTTEWRKYIIDATTEGTLNGIEMLLECFNTKTKAGNDFTIHRWELPPE